MQILTLEERQDVPDKFESLTPAEIRKEAEYQKNVWKGFLIAIPYSASIGGTATLTGTAPNLLLVGSLKKQDVPDKFESLTPAEIRKEAEYQKNVWKGFLIAIPYSASIGGTATLTGTAPNLLLVGSLKNASTSAENVINSTELLNNATKEIGQEVLRINKEMQNLFKASLGDFDLAANVNVSEIRKEFHVVSQQVANDFLLAKMVLEETKLVTSRLLAGLFVLCLLIGSSWYLKGYLTDVKFDNVYITKQLEHLARENGRCIMPTAGLINSRGFKMSRRESFRCLVRLAVITLYLLLIISVIVADRVVFSFIVTIAPWLYDFPVIPMTIRVTYSVKIGVRGVNEINNFFNDVVNTFGGDGSKAQIPTETHKMDKNYEFGIPLLGENCLKKLSPPHSSIAVTVGVLHLVAFVMLVGEVYARRARRKISASFYKQREEERVNYLFQKIIEKEME
ncbi:UNVERIFIED_CONTAM: hypothetical protein FKN15_059116 [Acipenser sinensis]